MGEVNNTNAIDEWQATKTTLKQRFSVLCNNEKFADVYFNVGTGNKQRFPGHKLVFTVSSAVFEKMFFGSLSGNSDEIDLPDIEPSAFLAFLKYIYSEEVHIDSKIVMSTMYIAKKYNVPELKQQCLKFLKSNLNKENVISLLIEAHHLDEPEAEEWCLEYIDRNATQVLTSDDFIHIDLNHLIAIIQRDTLRIREIQLYKVVIKWAEAACTRKELSLTPENLRSVLGKAFMLIRFPLMSMDEFGGAGPIQDRLFTNSEIQQLIIHLTNNPKPPIHFIDVPRSEGGGKEQIVSRFKTTNVELNWSCPGNTTDFINIVVDRQIFIVGFGLYGSTNGSKHDVTIELERRFAQRTSINYTNTSFSSDGTSKTFHVRFTQPIKIEPNTIYTARVKLKGPPTLNGCEGQDQVTIIDEVGLPVNFQFSFHSGRTNVLEGQIPEIIFHI